MSTLTPLISVLMPVYNVEKFVGPAIESILAQSCADFEFLIVCDAPADASLEVVKSYRDPRIQVIEHAENRGISVTMNTGLQRAAGQFVAVMDSDDLAMPSRFEKQAALLAGDPSISICGSRAPLIDGSGNKIGEFKAPLGAALDAFYWRPSPVLHPSAMYRNPQGRWRYSEGYRWVVDYDLFLRLGRSGRIFNFEEPLVQYRRHTGAVGVRGPSQQEDECYRMFLDCCDYEVPQTAFRSLVKWSYELPSGQRHRWMRRVASDFCGGYGKLHLLDDLRYARRRLSRRGKR